VPGSYSRGKASGASQPAEGSSGGGFFSLFSRGNQTAEVPKNTPVGGASAPSRPTFVSDDPFSTSSSRPGPSSAKRAGGPARKKSPFGSDSDDDSFLKEDFRGL
jgi:hypothetical protein